MTDTITVAEAGRPLAFSFDTLMLHHGGGFPGGVAHALKAMQAGFAALSDAPLERREITVVTAFSGPGGRDAIECVTRAISDGRFTLDRSLNPGNVIDTPPGPYLWCFGYRGATVEVTIRPGHVREEFVRLGAKPDKTEAEVARHEELKAEMASRLLPQPATDIYEVRRL